MRYPMFVNWTTFTRLPDGSCRVTDWMEGRTFRFSEGAARFAKRLDGRTNPYAVRGRLTRRQTGKLLRGFEERGLLRRSRVLDKSFLSVCRTVLLFRGRPPRRAAALVNFALLLLWLPVFVSGVKLFLCAGLPLEEPGFLAGALWGSVPGIMLHELAHACAAWGYGGFVFEFGVCLQYLMPGAYVMTDTSRVRGSLRQAQIDAAGVEQNLLLAGACLFLAAALPAFASFLGGAAYGNTILAMGNLLPLPGVDGGRILADLLGLPELDSCARRVALSRKRRKRLFRAGASGKAAVFACCLLSLLQLVWPLFLAVAVVEAFL